MVGSSRRAALAAGLVLIAGVTLSAVSGAHTVWVYWAASSLAILGALVLIVTGECAWDRMLANARAAGVVAPQ